MNLIGTRFATFRDEDMLVKCEDMHVESRLRVRCFREALAAQLAQRLGLAVPATQLDIHTHYGRIVTRQWITDVRTPTPREFQSLRCTPTGFRVLLLDLLIANSDRRPDNLLLRCDDLVPIDHNLAFAFAEESRRAESPDVTIMRWFGVSGALALGPAMFGALDHEIARFAHLITEPYIHCAVARIPDAFLADQEERARLLGGLLGRRARVRSWIRGWWRRSIEPIHRITEATHD